MDREVTTGHLVKKLESLRNPLVSFPPMGEQESHDALGGQIQRALPEALSGVFEKLLLSNGKASFRVASQHFTETISKHPQDLPSARRLHRIAWNVTIGIA